MADKPLTPDQKPSPEAAAPNSAPKRSPGHRGADVRDTVAEMAAKAQEISQEAGSKMAAAMRDVISAAAGMVSFAADSARDLVQYMVRRGQMTQEEADKLIREAEEAAAKRNVNLPPPPSKLPKPPPPVVATTVVAPPVTAAPVIQRPPAKPAAPPATAPAPAAKHAAPAPAAKKAAPPAKHASPAKAKAPTKPAAAKKKPAAKKR